MGNKTGFTRETGRAKTMGMNKPSVLLLGSAVVILAVIAAGRIDRASAEQNHQKKPKPVEVVNTPLDVNVVDGTSTNVLGFSTQVTEGRAGGVAGLHRICQTDFSNPDARVCTSGEVMRSPRITSLSPGAGWVQPELVTTGVVTTPQFGDAAVTAWRTDISGVTHSRTFNNTTTALNSSTLNCSSWNDDTDTTIRGLIYTTSEGFKADQCYHDNKVICCGPVP